MSKQTDFINEIAPIILRQASSYGYSVASVTIAQACLESGYGNAWSRANHNYFGIKYGSWVKRTKIASKLSVIKASTKEEYQVGKLTKIIDGFVKCPDMETGVILYFEFLRVNKRYKDLPSKTTALSMAQGLKAAGYATSSTYVTNLMKVVNCYNLTKYDGVAITTATADLTAVAKDVIAGKYGNGTTRKKNLTAAGYDYTAVQKAVNQLLKG